MTPHRFTLRVLLGASLLAAMSWAASPAAASAHGTVKLAPDADEHDFAASARFPVQSAVRVALKRASGVVTWIGLMNEDGYLYYGVQTLGSRGAVSMVTLDAGSGKVTDVTTRTADQVKADDAKEAAEDAAKAKADPNSEEARKAKEAAKPDTGPHFISSAKVAPGADQAAQASALKISVFFAMTTAVKRIKGKVASVSLTSDHGNVYYAVTIREGPGKMTLVAVDAGDGKVLGTTEGG